MPEKSDQLVTFFRTEEINMEENDHLCQKKVTKMVTFFQVKFLQCGKK